METECYFYNKERGAQLQLVRNHDIKHRYDIASVF